MSLSRRLSALLVVFGLFSSHAALCAGWMAMPEAPVECPMHDEAARHSTSTVPGGTGQLAPCCAMSDRDDTASLPPAFALSPSLSPVDTLVPLVAPRFVLRSAGRRFVPPPGAHVPRHLLLSVLLV